MAGGWIANQTSRNNFQIFIKNSYKLLDKFEFEVGCDVGMKQGFYQLCMLGRWSSYQYLQMPQWAKTILGPLQYQKISLNIKTFDYLIVAFHTAHGLLIYVYRWAIIDIKLQWIWKFEKVKGKVQLHYPQGVSKNASKGDVKFFNPEYVTIGSGIDQNKKITIFFTHWSENAHFTLKKGIFWPMGQLFVFIIARADGDIFRLEKSHISLRSVFFGTPCITKFKISIK